MLPDNDRDILRGIADCLDLVGRDGFAARLVALVERIGADQVMVFAYEADRARCLISRNFDERALGQHLAEDYLDGWFRRDPLFRLAMDMEEGHGRVVRLAEFGAAFPPEYRERFYAVPQIGDKTAVLVAGGGLRLGVNVYWREAERAGNEVLRALGRMVHLHFIQAAPSAVPPALGVLSERERDVCLGILAGKKAEIIAHELGVKPSSVATYRARAYEKLGINSRGSLFAICRA